MYEYKDLVDFFLMFLSGCGVISIVGGAWFMIKRLKQPSDDFHKKVENHEQYLQRDFARLNEIETDNKVICKALLVLINHGITNNGIDRMKEVRDELQEYLIDK